MTLGQSVKARRTALGMTQADLASKVGVGVPWVSKVESGRETPSERGTAHFAAVLGLDPVELLLASGRVPTLVADRLRHLLDVVQALASVDPTGFDPDCCTLCRRVIVPAGPHAEDCPWFRARAFLASRETP